MRIKCGRRSNWTQWIPVILLAGITGCGSPPAQRPAPPPVAVTVAQPLVRDFTRFADFSGRVTPVDQVELRSRVGGFVEKILVEDGTIIEEGQEILRIDSAPYEATLKAREAAFVKAQAALKLAEANTTRSRPLVRTGAIPAQEFDVILAQEAMAKAELAAAEAAVVSARLDVTHTRVKAPISGRLSDIPVSTGSLVASGAGAAGTPLGTIVSVKPVHVSFDVDENTYLSVRRPNTTGRPTATRDLDIPVMLAIGESRDFSLAGTLDYSDPSINPQTGTLRLRALFPNQDLKLVPGLFVRTRVALENTPNTILIPVRALGQNQDRFFVYCIDDKNTVQYREIQTGPEQDGLVVVREGLVAEDRLIIDGTLKVRPGATVDPKPADLSRFKSNPAAAQN